MSADNNTVWVVMYKDYDDVSVEAVCVTEEAAIAFAKEQNRADEYRNNYWVYEKQFTFPLDPKPWVYALLGGDPATAARESEQLTGGFAFWPREGFEQDRSKYDV